MLSTWPKMVQIKSCFLNIMGGYQWKKWGSSFDGWNRKVLSSRVDGHIPIDGLTYQEQQRWEAGKEILATAESLVLVSLRPRCSTPLPQGAWSALTLPQQITHLAWVIFTLVFAIL